MITIKQKPSDISFAGNPVLVKVSSGLSEKTFLKICANVNIKIYQRDKLLSDYTRTLSIPTNGGGEEMVFDLSDLLLSALSQINIERNGVLSGGTPSYTSGYVKYGVKLWDEYLDEYAEIVSSENSASVSMGECVAIPGAYTDMQRLLRTEDTEEFLGKQNRLSNKPDFEVIPTNGKVVVPVFSTENTSSNVYLDSVNRINLVGSHTLYASEASWKTLTLPASEGVHSLVWDGIPLSPFFFYAVKEKPFTHYFEFVNRLGAVESVYTFGRATHKRKLTQERQVKKHGMTFRPTARYVKRTLQEEETLVLTTGPVSREWAQWFVSEFFTSEKVWMYSEEADDMIPVVIECEEDLDVFNESEAAVLNLPFTVVKCING